MRRAEMRSRDVRRELARLSLRHCSARGLLTRTARTARDTNPSIGETMAQQIQEIMTKQLHTIRSEATLVDVARMMRDKQIGNVLVTNPDGKLRGIVTDRDIVVRAAAESRPLDRTKVADILSADPVKVAPTATLDEAMQLMRKHAIRRVPVVQGDVPVGIVSLGDLARAKDPRSVLGEISAAPPRT
jgi:CBS domain-containing protein